MAAQAATSSRDGSPDRLFRSCSYVSCVPVVLVVLIGGLIVSQTPSLASCSLRPTSSAVSSRTAVGADGAARGVGADPNVIGIDQIPPNEVVSLRWLSLPGLESELPAEAAPSRVFGSLATTPYGRGDASVVSLGGTRWVLHSVPLENDSSSIAQNRDVSLTAEGRCHIGAAHGERLSYEFAEQVNLRPIDRMNDRTTLDPSVRTFVHYVHPLPGNAAPIDFPRAHRDDHAKLCAFKHVLRREHLPRGGCPDAPWTNISEPFPGGPWCAQWDAPVFIAELRCAFMETAFAHDQTGCSVISQNGGYMSHHALRSGLFSALPVTEYDTLATAGYMEYGGSAGHFYNEVLPRLVHMDAFLPAHVPLVWPAGDLPARILGHLQDMGIVSRARTFIPLGAPGNKTLSRARTLYLYGTTAPLQQSPVVTWFSQYYLAARLRKYFAAAVAAGAGGSGSSVAAVQPEVESSNSSTGSGDASEPGFAAKLDPGDRSGGEGEGEGEVEIAPDKLRLLRSLQSAATGGRPRNSIVVLRRYDGLARSIENHGELMAALRDRFPDRSVEDWQATKDNFLETGAVMYHAAVIVGPHGANMNNMLYARRGTAVVEIGFVDTADMSWPPDYLCLARNLGLPYWASVTKRGEYHTPLVIHVQRTVEIVAEALATTAPVDDSLYLPSQS